MQINFDHVWFWNPRMGERSRKGLHCRVLVRGARNSVLVELEDGEKVVASRYAVRALEARPRRAALQLSLI
jgi:hypothetical protein